MNRDAGRFPVRVELADGALRIRNGKFLVDLHGLDGSALEKVTRVSRLVVQFDPDLKVRLAERFLLTPSEAEIAFALVEGHSSNAIADLRGVSLNTVRNQIRIVLEKCGVQRRGDLFRLATSD